MVLGLFSSCGERGLLSCCGAEFPAALASLAKHGFLGDRASVAAARGLSSCGPRALDALLHTESSRTRDQGWNLCSPH